MKTGKPQAKIGVVGFSGHGKTSLAAALSKAFGGAAGSCETAKRRYELVDCPGRAASAKKALAEAGPLDGAVFVVSAVDGPRTREHAALLREAGVPRVVVFLNKCDRVDDAELLEFVQMEIRELLTVCGFPGENISVVQGSALKAAAGDASRWGEPSIRLLAEALDVCLAA
jgi:elongation factor Tu